MANLRILNNKQQLYTWAELLNKTGAVERQAAGFIKKKNIYKSNI